MYTKSKKKKMSNHYYGDDMNWSTYGPMKKTKMKKSSYWSPTPLLFINPAIVCSDKKAKVC